MLLTIKVSKTFEKSERKYCRVPNLSCRDTETQSLRACRKCRDCWDLPGRKRRHSTQPHLYSQGGPWKRHNVIAAVKLITFTVKVVCLGFHLVIQVRFLYTTSFTGLNLALRVLLIFSVPIIPVGITIRHEVDFDERKQKWQLMWELTNLTTKESEEHGLGN